MLDRAGGTAGFAKVGTHPLTRGLVRTETAALSALANTELRHLVVPKVLHAGRWQDHQVLVQQALPVWRQRSRLTAARLCAAMQEVASCCGISRAMLNVSPYWTQLRTRLGVLGT